MTNPTESRQQHARAIAAAGGFEQALSSGALPRLTDTTLCEAIILGLLRQGVSTYFAVFGHGSTEVAEVLRIYQQHGLVRVLNVRSEIEASHAATALRWMTGQKAAVVTSIGPGALQALAASIAPASDGIGVWYLLGDETTEDEGPNMQQIPLPRQDLFLQLFSTMGAAYTLHTPLSLPTALRRGLNTVDHPHRAGPFFLLMPMNTQPAPLPGFNLAELPCGAPPSLGAAGSDDDYDLAVDLLLQAQKVVVKVGGGGRHAGPEILEFLDLVNGVAVLNPIATGAIPWSHPRCMGVGGSKGSLCGNYAMENADLLVAVGTRAVCQSDCSRTGYPRVRHVININTSVDAALHYNRTLALVGEAALTLRKLNSVLRSRNPGLSKATANWLRQCNVKRTEWQAFQQARYSQPTLPDEHWGGVVLTQPAAIKTATDWARQHGIPAIFDAGDVQANGFQIVEDERPGQTYTETGASYMGFAVSALLATAAAQKPFYALALTGDGSFTMNPQILLDGVQHGATGCILLLDNGRMGAITGLQFAQYGAEFATGDSVVVDYPALARSVMGVLALSGGNSPQSLLDALEKARAHNGLALIHVPVYFGSHELGGMGVFGRWNVGNWVNATQSLRHQIGL